MAERERFDVRFRVEIDTESGPQEDRGELLRLELEAQNVPQQRLEHLGGHFQDVYAAALRALPCCRPEGDRNLAEDEARGVNAAGVPVD